MATAQAQGQSEFPNNLMNMNNLYRQIQSIAQAAASPSASQLLSKANTIYNLDQSWVQGLDYGVHGGWAFGRAVVVDGAPASNGSVLFPWNRNEIVKAAARDLSTILNNLQLESAKASTASAPSDANNYIKVGQLVMPGVPTQGGAVVEGSGGQTQRELLTTPGQDFFTRTTDHAENIRWDDWRRLKELLPANFDEAKYLTKHPDVANAVNKKVMPSGAWHYVMYGMPNCQAKASKGTPCENRDLAGWLGLAGLKKLRRPGYLSGYRPWS